MLPGGSPDGARDVVDMLVGGALPGWNGGGIEVSLKRRDTIRIAQELRVRPDAGRAGMAGCWAAPGTVGQGASDANSSVITIRGCGVEVR